MTKLTKQEIKDVLTIKQTRMKKEAFVEAFIEYHLEKKRVKKLDFYQRCKLCKIIISKLKYDKLKPA